jgi:hypothetical protein
MKIIKKIRNSLNYRKRYFYSKITRVYWMVISNILLSNKRDVRKKDILYVFVPVWGKWHISLFFQYTMPSLMQSNNLPAVSKEKKIIINFYTQDLDAPTIHENMSNYANIYDYYIYLESEFTDLGRDKMANYLIHTLDKCVAENALMLLALPDFFYSDYSVKNLVSLSECKGVSISVPHPRVSYECIQDKLTMYNGLKISGSVNSESLVERAILCKHMAIELCDELKDENHTYYGGISIRELTNNNLVVVHNLPAVLLISPIIDDILFFRRRVRFNDIDTIWPHMLLRQSRLKVVGSSDIAFMVELTKDSTDKPPVTKGKKYNDQYGGVRPFCNYANVILNSWRPAKNK